MGLKSRVSNGDRLSTLGWLLVFITLFWLRQSANLFVGIGRFILTGKISKSGDEAKLDYYLDIPPWTIEILTGLIGLAILAFLIFKIIPPKQRVICILAGLSGGVTGYILWLNILGPIIMP